MVKLKKQLRMGAGLMSFNAVVASINSILNFSKEDFVRGGIFAFVAVISGFSVVMSLSALRELKKEQNTEE